MPNGGKAIGTLYGVPKLPHIICHAKRSIGASSSAHILARDPRQLAAQITGRYGRDGIFLWGTAPKYAGSGCLSRLGTAHILVSALSDKWFIMGAFNETTRFVPHIIRLGVGRRYPSNRHCKYP